MTDASDRIPWDTDARLREPLDDLARSLEVWHGRDESRPQPHVRRAANKAMDAMDGMLRELHLMRARLVSEVRESDDAAAARSDALLAASRPDWCKRCRRTTFSVPCLRCDGPACVICDRCPECDGPLPEDAAGVPDVPI